jgi:hypothetical protein
VSWLEIEVESRQTLAEVLVKVARNADALRFLGDLSRFGRGLIEMRPERLDFVAAARDAARGFHSFTDERQ